MGIVLDFVAGLPVFVPSQSPRPVRAKRWVLAAVLLVSVCAHGAVIATTDFELSNAKGAFKGGELSTTDVELTFSCWSDAYLALAAQTLSCALPGAGSENCEATAWSNYHFDVILCGSLQSDDDIAAEAVTFMNSEEIEAIEALPLLDVEALDELEAAKLLEAEVEEKIAEAQERISDPQQSGQVIEITAPSVEIAPEKTRFLSEYDSRVEKESVARGSTEEMVAKPSPKELPAEEAPEPLPEDPEPSGEESSSEELVARVEDGDSTEGSTSKASPLLAMRAQESRLESSLGERTGADALEANGLAAAKGSGAQDQRGQSAQEGREAVNAGMGARSTPNLRPSEDTLARVVGGGSVDRLDGIESGDFTAINSKKWKFASFFNRMKRQVAQNWHPDTVYLRRDPTGKVYGTKDRVTVLEVSLKPNGSLANVVVFQQSGIDFLDAEAINAFHLAQPFPNPPSGLVDAGSQLITFSFGFQFQVGSRSDSWKIFRYN